MNKQINDIERYLNGQMTAAEMHAFEKQMLSDPFLSDAVDGYREQWQEIQQREDLIQLEAQIQKRNNSKTRVIAGGFRQWMSIAALLVVILSSAVVLYRIFSPNKETRTIASKEQATSTEPENKIIPQTTVDSQTVAVNEKQKHYPTENKPGVNNKTAPTKIIQNEELPVNSPDSTSLAAAELKTPPKVSGTTAPVAAEPAPPQVTAQREETREADEALTRKKEKASVMTAKPATATKEKAAPVSGWVEYTTYMKENIKTPAEISTKDQNHFTVEVSFSVDTDGTLSNFKIEKSTCQPCNAEAIRLIKEGPAWKTNTGQKEKVTYTVSFN